MATFGVLGMICTSFFYFKYFFAGEFDQAHHMRGKPHSMMGMMPENSNKNHVMMSPEMLKNMNTHMVSTMSQCMDRAQGKTIDAEAKSMVMSCFQSDVVGN